MSSTAGTDPSTGFVPCARHPKVQTALRCSSCGTPICPDCMVPAAVGNKCPDCARLPRSARVVLKPSKALAAIGASFGVGTVAGALIGAFGAAFSLGFFSFIVGWGVGVLCGRVVVSASGHHRSSTAGWIAVSGAVWCYVVAAGVFAYDYGVGIRAGIQIIGLAIAAYFAYREAT